MNKSIRKTLLALLLILLLAANVSFAENSQEFKLIGLSEDYKEWSKLSEEEKSNTKMPKTYKIDIKNSIIRSRFNNLLKGETEPLDKYNLADKIKINVKDQQKTNLCWASAATSAIETYLAMKNNNIFDMYSARHMEYTMSNSSFTDGINSKGLNRAVGTGGNTQLSGAYLAAIKGPVTEKDMPFENNEDKISLKEIDKNIGKTVKSFKTFPDIYKRVIDGQIKYYDGTSISATEYSEAEVNAIRNEIKQFLKTTGAITISMQAEGQYLNDAKVKAGTADKYAYYCDSNGAGGNHAITLVGWDDTFSKENFNDNHKPLNDGAWIALNSWGTDKESCTNDGYIYISYDDAVVETDMMGILNVTDKDYDYLYQYDEFGVTNALGGKGTVYTANIYDTKEKGNEELKEIGLYVISTQNIELYANVTDGSLTNLEKVAAPGVLEPGYYTIPLTTPKTITGDKFAVAIKATNSELVTIPLEYNPISNGEIAIPGTTIGFFNVITAEKGQSYISFDGGKTYTDILESNNLGKKYKDINLSIKALTSLKEKQPVKVTNISLDKSSLILEEGATGKLTATFTPTEAENKEVTWTSSNPQVAEVDANGNVTAVAEGTATITVASKETSSVKDTCNVTVIKKGDFILSLDKTSAVMNKGDLITLKPIFTPSTIENQKVTWESSNAQVAKVDEDGKVTAVEEGTATITVKSEANQERTAKCEITVKGKIDVESVAIDVKSKELYIGDKIKLNATVTPTDATDKTVKWESSDATIADVDSTGTVTAKAKGVATIVVTTNDGDKKDTSTITVKEKEEDTTIKVESISINKTKVDMQIGDTTSLVVTFTPTNATNKNVTWKMADESIATVDRNGIITAVKEGKTTLTVTTEDGNKTAEAEINVTKKTNTADDIYKPNTNTPNSNPDTTTAEVRLPNAGKITITIAIMLVIGYLIWRFTKLYKLRDIK